MKSLYTPRGYQQTEAARFHENRHIEMLSVQPHATATFTAQKLFSLLNFFTGCVDPRDIVWPGGLCQWIFPATPRESNPLTSGLKCSASINCGTACPLLPIMCYHSFSVVLYFSLPSKWKIFKKKIRTQSPDKTHIKHKLQEQKIKHFIFRPINFVLSKCAV